MTTPDRKQHAAGWLVLAGMVTLAGCAQRPASLDTAQTSIQTARANADVNTYAPAELDSAQTELQSANKAWEEGHDRDEAAHRAALATQQVEIAQASAEARKAQAQIASLGDQREKVMRQSAEQQVQTLQQQLADMKARQTDRGIVLTVGDVLFDTGQATLKPGAVNEIVRLASFLKENPDRGVRIEGHTDSTVDGDQHGPVAASRRYRGRHAGLRRHPARPHRRRRLRAGCAGRIQCVPRPAGNRTAASRWSSRTPRRWSGLGPGLLTAGTDRGMGRPPASRRRP